MGKKHSNLGNKDKISGLQFASLTSGKRPRVLQVILKLPKGYWL